MTGIRFLITAGLACTCASLLYAQNDQCPGGSINNLPFSEEGFTSGFADDFHPTCSPGLGPDGVFMFTPPGSARYHIYTCGTYSPSINTVLYVRVGSCTGAEVACNDDIGGNCGTFSSVYPLLNGGQTYVIIIDSPTADERGRYYLFVECPNTIRLLGDMPYDVSGTTVGQGNHVDPSCGNAGSSDVMYVFQPYLSDNFIVWLEADYNCVLHVRTNSFGTCAPGNVEIACSNDFCGSTNMSYLAVFMLNDRDYYIIVDGSSSSGNYRLGMSRDYGVIDTLCGEGSISYSYPSAQNNCVSSCISSSADRTVVVPIPFAGMWRFSLCPNVSHDYLCPSEFCCGPPLSGFVSGPCGGSPRSQFDFCVSPSDYGLGFYFVTVEGLSSSGGNFTLTASPVYGSCCYTSGGAPMCTENATKCFCDSVGGTWYEGTTCLTAPCRPACRDEAVFGQPTWDAGESWTLGISDDAVGQREYDNFSFGEFPPPISSMRFWATSVTNGLAPCAEQPVTISVRFHADSSGWPRLGGPIRLYNYYSLPGEWIGNYLALSDTYAVYQYDVQFPSSFTMTSGWVTVYATAGYGDPSCWFSWMNSPFGDGTYRYRYNNAWGSNGGNKAFCLESGTSGGILPCELDGIIDAPGSYSGSTCGADNDCSLDPNELWNTQDQLVRVYIPTFGQWTFSLCGSAQSWDSKITLMTTCCATEWPSPSGILEQNLGGCTPSGLSQISCATLNPGYYYVLVENDPGENSCTDDFTLTVTPCPTCQPPDSLTIRYLTNPPDHVHFDFRVYHRGYFRLFATTSTTAEYPTGFTEVGNGYAYQPGTYGISHPIYESQWPYLYSRYIVMQDSCAPTNDLCQDAMLITNGQRTYSNIAARTDGPASFCSSVSRDVWFRYIATCTGNIQVSTCNSPAPVYDTVIDVYGGTCENLGNPLGCNDNGCGYPLSTLAFNAVAGNEYLIRVSGSIGAQGNGILSVSCQ